MKYELTNENLEIGKKNLFRIRALKDFAHVKAGDLGGWIESESNLSQEGTCWVSGEAQVFGEACVFGSAWVHGEAQVYDSAQVSGSAQVYDSAQVFGEACVFGSAQVYDSARVYDSAWVHGEAQVYDSAQVYGSARVSGRACIKSVADYIVVGPAQSSGRFTTAYIVENSTVVTTGCFTGTLEEFKRAIEKTHEHNPSCLKQYRSFANLIAENFQ